MRQAIEDKADEIVRVSKTILENPEAGFREVKTSKLVADVFNEWGINHRTGLALTGVKGTGRKRQHGAYGGGNRRAGLADRFGASPRRR